MKIILDECLPKRLTTIIPFDQVFTVPQIGLAGFSDTELLNALDEKKIDVFITIDNGISSTNKNFRIGFLVQLLYVPLVTASKIYSH